RRARHGGRGSTSMRSVRAVPALVAGALAVVPISSALAQEAPTPAPPAEQLPPVEVQQKQATPAPAKKKSAAKKKQPSVSPAPQPPPAAMAAPDPASILPNSMYGSPAGAGAAERAYQSAATPVNPTALVPARLEGFSSAATVLTGET